APCWRPGRTGGACAMSSKSSKTKTDAARADLPERVAVGRVLRPHGVRGEVVVEVLSDVPARLDPGRVVIGVREGQPELPLVVESHRPHKSGALIRFADFGDRDRAEELRGVWLEVERSQVPAAPTGTYYWYQLLGCQCRTREQDLG